MKKEILKQLKSEYHKQELQPSADLWDRMEQKLDTNPVIAPQKSFEWMKYAAVVLLLISTGVILYFNSGKSVANNTVAKNENLEKIEKQQEVTSETVVVNQKENENFVTVESLNITKTNEVTIVSPASHPSIIRADNSFQVVKEERIQENNVNISSVIEDKKIFNEEKPVIAERKRTNYIKADELLLGREFDKTREQNHNYNQNIGMLDMGQITIKSPNSFKVLGMTVFSDSVQSR